MNAKCLSQFKELPAISETTCPSHNLLVMSASFVHLFNCALFAKMSLSKYGDKLRILQWGGRYYACRLLTEPDYRIKKYGQDGELTFVEFLRSIKDSSVSQCPRMIYKPTDNDTIYRINW